MGSVSQTHTHTLIHTHAHALTHTHTQMHTYTNAHKTHTHTHRCTRTQMHTHRCTQNKHTHAHTHNYSFLLSLSPEQERTLIGIATFDSSVHYYAMRGPGTQPQMLVMCDTMDVFAPEGAQLLVPVGPNKAELKVCVCCVCVCVCVCVCARICMCMLVMCDTMDVFTPEGARLLVPVEPNKAELHVIPVYVCI
jgi:hypothetical protein